MYTFAFGTNKQKFSIYAMRRFNTVRYKQSESQSIKSRVDETFQSI